MYQELESESLRMDLSTTSYALAPPVPAELQNQIYQQAAWKARGSGDATRARQTITDFISDPTQRKQMLAQIENQFVEASVNADKIGEARQLLGGALPEQRVQILPGWPAFWPARATKRVRWNCSMKRELWLMRRSRVSVSCHHSYNSPKAMLHWIRTRALPLCRRLRPGRMN